MKHEVFEKNSIILLVGILVVVSIGGLFEIAPLFWVDSTIEKVKGMRPYTPLEQAGRDVYVREGCYNLPQPDGAHASRRGRALRPLQPRRREHVRSSLPVGLEADRARSRARRRQVLRSVARRAHGQSALGGPRESIMPSYPWLMSRQLDAATVEARLKTLRAVGVPYTEEMIASVRADLAAQINPDSRPSRELLKRYPKAKVAKFDGRPGVPPTEMDALVAYLQVLGQLVDFATFDAAGPNLR